MRKGQNLPQSYFLEFYIFVTEKLKISKIMTSVFDPTNLEIGLKISIIFLLQEAHKRKLKLEFPWAVTTHPHVFSCLY